MANVLLGCESQKQKTEGVSIDPGHGDTGSIIEGEPCIVESWNHGIVESWNQNKGQTEGE